MISSLNISFGRANSLSMYVPKKSDSKSDSKPNLENLDEENSKHKGRFEEIAKLAEERNRNRVKIVRHARNCWTCGARTNSSLTNDLANYRDPRIKLAKCMEKCPSGANIPIVMRYLKVGKIDGLIRAIKDKDFETVQNSILMNSGFKQRFETEYTDEDSSKKQSLKQSFDKLNAVHDFIENFNNDNYEGAREIFDNNNLEKRLSKLGNKKVGEFIENFNADKYDDAEKIFKENNLGKLFSKLNDKNTKNFIKEFNAGKYDEAKMIFKENNLDKLLSRFDNKNVKDFIDKFKAGQYPEAKKLFNNKESKVEALFSGYDRAITNAFIQKLKEGNYSKAGEIIKDPLLSFCLKNSGVEDDINNIFADAVDDAYVALTTTNIYPELNGRLCEGHCEKNCAKRKQGTTKIPNFPEVEKFLGDYVKATRINPSPDGKNIAVVGGGPAGIAAATYLGKRGRNVLLCEAGPLIGGVLRTHIPEFRMDSTVLNKIQRRMEEIGVELSLNDPIDSNSVKDLLKVSDRVLIAVGAGIPKELGDDVEITNWKGEKVKNLEGMYNANQFLAIAKALVAKKGKIRKPKSLMENLTFEEMKLQGLQKKGVKIVVIGGGNVAMDVARTSAQDLVNQETIKEIAQQEEILKNSKARKEKFEKDLPIKEAQIEKDFAGNQEKIKEEKEKLAEQKAKIEAEIENKEKEIIKLRPVSIFYRRAEEDMPARQNEIIDAKKDRVGFQFMLAPSRIYEERKNGQLVKKVEFKKMVSAGVGEDGRQQIEAAKDANGKDIVETVEADVVVNALGSKVDEAAIKNMLGLKADDKLVIDKETGALSKTDKATGVTVAVPKVHIIGDAAGTGTAIAAMSQGLKTARAIDIKLSLPSDAGSNAVPA